MQGRLGVGICGARVARNHVEGYQLLEGVDVLCIAGPDVDRCTELAREFGLSSAFVQERKPLRQASKVRR